MQGTQELLCWILGRRARQGQRPGSWWFVGNLMVGAGERKLKLEVPVATMGAEVGELKPLGLLVSWLCYFAFWMLILGSYCKWLTAAASASSSSSSSRQAGWLKERHADSCSIRLVFLLPAREFSMTDQMKEEMRSPVTQCPQMLGVLGWDPIHCLGLLCSCVWAWLGKSELVQEAVQSSSRNLAGM